ncbi:hypothetical protein AVEN_108756-1, partial [Araneus ventricosus]
GQMISLELKGGKVVYQLKFDSRTHIRLETKKKYNTGRWIRVEAATEDSEGSHRFSSVSYDFIACMLWQS